MAASARPQPEPRYQDVKEPFDFFSFQAGYLKGGLLPNVQWTAVHVPLSASWKGLGQKILCSLWKQLQLPLWEETVALGNVRPCFYAAGDLYLRPPHVLVATAMAGCNPNGTGLPSQTWQRADWLNRLSIANKQDFARLQGFRFLFTHVKARRT